MQAKLISPTGEVTLLSDELYWEIIKQLQRSETQTPIRQALAAIEQLPDSDKPAPDEIAIEING